MNDQENNDQNKKQNSDEYQFVNHISVRFKRCFQIMAFLIFFTLDNLDNY